MLSGLLLSLVAPAAMAHTRSQSASKWTLEAERADFVFRVDARRVTQLALTNEEQTLNALLRAHLQRHLKVRQGGQDCALEQLAIQGGAQSGKLIAQGSFRCVEPINAETTARISVFSEVSPTHIHLAHVAGGGAGGVAANAANAGRHYILHAGELEFPLRPPAKATPQSLSDFLRLGVSHVLSGADHIAFLIALMLAAVTWRRMFYCITGFTLGHSLTLALVTFGIIRPQTHLIEALIGYSIALTAVEIMRSHRRLPAGHWLLAIAVMLVGLFSHEGGRLLFAALLTVFSLSLKGAPRAAAHQTTGSGPQKTPEGARWLVLVAVLFGLIHGAGFAGGLVALDLSTDHLIGPLLGFNLGVEVAQLMILTIVLGAYIWLRRYRQVARWALSTALPLVSAGLFGLGLYWYGTRLLSIF